MVRVGFIGCGNIFKRNISAVLNVDNTEVVGLCDTDVTKLLQQKEEYKIEYTNTDYKQFIKESNLDVVHICTPHYLHAEMVCFALEYGVNVIVEKPLCLSRMDYEKIKLCMQKSGKKVEPIFQNRYNESIIEAKRIIDQKELGDVKGAKIILAWNRNKEYYKSGPWRGDYALSGGGLMMNQAIHNIDLLRYLISDIVSVESMVGNFYNPEYDIEDTVFAKLNMENNISAVFFGTTGYVYNSPVNIEIVLESGILQIESNVLIVKNAQNNKVVRTINDVDTASNHYWGNGHYKQISEFYKNLDTDIVGVSIDDAWRAVEIIQEIYKRGNLHCN